MLCNSLIQEFHVIVLCTCVPHVGVGVHYSVWLDIYRCGYMSVINMHIS